MKQDVENEIALLHKVIAGLEREGKIKDELIKAQKSMIKTLENHISDLQNLIEEMQGFEPKG